jgi:hypothetical protein
MFISGFIIQKTLHNSVSLPTVLIAIYLPYIIYVAIAVMFSITTSQHCSNSIDLLPNYHNQKNTIDISELVCSINIIGVYIILCSVVAELLLHANTRLYSTGITTASQSAFISTLLSSIEITRGVELITSFSYFDTQKITALILGLTSFGGISSILQTRQVIQNSGLSIKKYILVKLICGCASYALTLTFI